MAADGVVLVAQPDHQDHIEGRGRVLHVRIIIVIVHDRASYLEELRHDGFHADEGQDDGEEGGRREGDVRVELEHLQQVHDEDEDLVLGVSARREIQSLSQEEIWYLSSIEMDTVKMIMTTAAAT